MQKCCLMIMQPRKLPEVIESIKKVQIPKVWFRGYNSIQIEMVMNKFVDETVYDSYIVMSDDLVISLTAFQIVLENTKKYPVFSGYCNMFLGSPHVNLSASPLTLTFGDFPRMEDYPLMTQEEVNLQKTDIFQTYYVGYALTAIHRDVWLKYPFAKYKRMKSQGLVGESSDHNFSYRLTKGGVPMHTHKNAGCKHLTHPGKGIHHRTLKDTMFVGTTEPVTCWEP